MDSRIRNRLMLGAFLSAAVVLLLVSFYRKNKSAPLSLGLKQTQDASAGGAQVIEDPLLIETKRREKEFREKELTKIQAVERRNIVFFNQLTYRQDQHEQKRLEKMPKTGELVDKSAQRREAMKPMVQRRLEAEIAKVNQNDAREQFVANKNCLIFAQNYRSALAAGDSHDTILVKARGGAEKYDEQAVTKLANKLDSLIQAEKNPALIQQKPELLNLVPTSMRNDPKKSVDYLRGGGVCKDG